MKSAAPFTSYKGFTPSVDPTTPGAILDCSMMVPTLRGMRGARSPVPFGNPALPNPCTGAATCELLDGGYRTFLGDATDLFEVANGLNNNVSQVAGGYTGGANPWRFVQFGNATVATNGSDPLQQSINTGKFSAIGSVYSMAITAAGSGYTSVPTVTVAAPAHGGTAATATATLTPTGTTPIGGVASATIGAGGSGYTSAPAVTFSDGGGSGATGTATISGGAVTGITITAPGSGYTSAPTITLTGGAGTGAAATAKLATGTVTGITMTGQGSGYGYSESPAITFTGGGGTGAAASATMQSAPIASILEVVQGFVFAFDTTDPLNGHRPNGWWCSGLYDQTNWYPDQSTQGANGVIVDQPGKITAAKALGTNIIVYKAQSMFYGVYEGPPVIWAMNQISPQVGTPAQECVVPVGSVHYFLGTDKQVYMFDGTTPTPIGDEVHDWLGSTWSSIYQSVVQSYHDQTNTLIYWYFVSTNQQGSDIDTCLVYNYRTGKFGRADMPIQATVQAVSGQITWDGMGSLPNVSTWSTLPQIPYNSPYWMQSSINQGVVDTTNRLQQMNGASKTSSLTTGWLGDDYNYMDWLGFVPRFSQQPQACTGVARTMSQLGGTMFTDWSIGPFYDGELASDFSSRYCQVTLSFTGDHEILGMASRIESSGEI